MICDMSQVWRFFGMLYSWFADQRRRSKKIKQLVTWDISSALIIIALNAIFFPDKPESESARRFGPGEHLVLLVFCQGHLLLHRRHRHWRHGRLRLQVRRHRKVVVLPDLKIPRWDISVFLVKHSVLISAAHYWKITVQDYFTGLCKSAPTSPQSCSGRCGWWGASRSRLACWCRTTWCLRASAVTKCGLKNMMGLNVMQWKSDIVILWHC